MKPDDPNFPQEIPPIPKPREGGNDSFQVDTPTPQGKASAHSPDIDSIDYRGRTPEEDISEDQIEGNTADARGHGSDRGIAFDDSRETFDSRDIDYDQTLEEFAAEPVTSQPTVPEPPTPPQATGRRPSAADPQVAATPPVEDWGQSDVPYQPKELGIIDQLLLLLADGAASWRKVLRWVRSQLPPTWQRRLSDEVMTAIALGLLVLFLALGNPLGGGQTNQPVAEPAVPPPRAEAPQNNPESSYPQEETPELAPAPGIAPLPDETPEQGLIADIQAQVSNISRLYAAGLIQSVEVNLPQNRLTINLGENWYGLLDEQQNEVSQNIFEQVQQLDFRTLQFRDPEGIVVARNPVVGNDIVILHRSRSSGADLLIS